MKMTSKEVLARYMEDVGPTDRYVVCNFRGGNVEMAMFLNAMPPSWKLISSVLATSSIGSPAALFEINQPAAT
jgi:hypothetical protein